MIGDETASGTAEGPSTMAAPCSAGYQSGCGAISGDSVSPEAGSEGEEEASVTKGVEREEECLDADRVEVLVPVRDPANCLVPQ